MYNTPGEIDALARGDRQEFDRAFWGHIGHVVRNATRAALLSVTRGWLARPPRSRAVLGEEYESRIAPLQIADKARGD